jgi:hypothetical protein
MGIASDNQMLAAQIVVAIAAFPSADSPSGSAGQKRIAKKLIHAMANPQIAREVGRARFGGKVPMAGP